MYSTETSRVVAGPSLRVLHLDHSDEFGGAELALARMLRTRPRWQSVLVLPQNLARRDDSLSPFNGLEQFGVQIARVGPPSRVGASRSHGLLSLAKFVFNTGRQVVAVGRVVRKARPHFVWANSSRAAVYTALIPWVRSTMLVVHLRDRIDVDSLGRFGYLAMTRLVLPRAGVVIANSTSTLASARPYFRAGVKTKTLQSPLGIARASSRGKALAGSDQGQRIRIGMLARLDPWKGQHLVIQAFAHLRTQTTRDLSLHLAGGAEFGQEAYSEELHQLIQDLDLADSVVFAGRVDDVTQFIDEMDICVQYSTRPEPLGQNVLQYLARGRAVLVAAEGGPAEWIRHGDNGLHVRPRSVSALAKGLLDVVEDDDRRDELACAALETPNLLTDGEVADEAAAFLENCMRMRGDSN